MSFSTLFLNVNLKQSQLRCLKILEMFVNNNFIYSSLPLHFCQG